MFDGFFSDGVQAPGTSKPQITTTLNRTVLVRLPATPSYPAPQSHTSHPETSVTPPANAPQAPARSAHSTSPATPQTSLPPAPGTTPRADLAVDRHAPRKSCTPPNTLPARCESVGTLHTQPQRLKKDSFPWRARADRDRKSV